MSWHICSISEMYLVVPSFNRALPNWPVPKLGYIYIILHLVIIAAKHNAHLWQTYPFHGHSVQYLYYCDKYRQFCRLYEDVKIPPVNTRSIITHWSLKLGRADNFSILWPHTIYIYMWYLLAYISVYSEAIIVMSIVNFDNHPILLSVPHINPKVN